MSNAFNNPFVFPGMAGTFDQPGSNPLVQSFEMMQKAWSALGAPGVVNAGIPGAQTFNLDELERRLTELRAVEHWLKLNLNMLEATIRALEVQRVTLSTLQSFTDSLASMAPEAARGAAPWSMFFPFGSPAPESRSAGDSAASGSARHTARATRTDDAAGAQAPDSERATGATQQPSPSSSASGAPPSSGDPSSTQQAAAAMTAAQQAWWNALQSQFSQLAAAAASTLPGAAAKAPAPEDPPADPAPSATAGRSGKSRTATRKATRNPGGTA